MSSIPNWCHNTLTVSGEAEELKRFLRLAAPRRSALRREYDQRWIIPEYISEDHREQYLAELGPKPSFETFVKQAREQQPLSFASLVPEPANLSEWERSETCWLCGGTGQRPRTEEEALRVREETQDKDDREMKFGEWVPWVKSLEDKVTIGEGCNGCRSTGRHIAREGWYEWRLRHWGTKWEASFGEPFMGIGAGDGVDFEASIESKRATITPTVAVYKFDTAWSPPSPVVETASEKFPELEFLLRFGEPGNGYAGEQRYVAGVYVEDEELEVEEVLAPEEMWF